MKRILMLPVVALGVILTGCDIPTPSVLSLEPAVTDRDATPDVPLAGVWESSNSDQVCLIHKEKDGAFSIMFLSGETPVPLKGRLFRAGDAMILDLEPEGDDYFRISGHAFARIRVEGSTLRWAFLDSDWCKEQIKALPSYAAGNRTLLLANGPAVRAFIEKAAVDERSLSTQVTWQRMQ